MKKTTILPSNDLARGAIVRFYERLRKNLTKKEARAFLFERFNLATGQPKPGFFFYKS